MLACTGRAIMEACVGAADWACLSRPLLANVSAAFIFITDL
jgi:hypothetical protein